MEIRSCRTLIKFGYRIADLHIWPIICKGLWSCKNLIVNMVWGRRNVENVILDTLRQIVSILDDVETTHRRGVYLDDVSDDEATTLNPNWEHGEDQDFKEKPILFWFPLDMFILLCSKNSSL